MSIITPSQPKIKVKAQILIVLDENDRVSVSTSSKNPVTNKGLLAVAQDMLTPGRITNKDSNGNRTQESN